MEIGTAPFFFKPILFLHAAIKKIEVKSELLLKNDGRHSGLSIPPLSKF